MKNTAEKSGSGIYGLLLKMLPRGIVLNLLCWSITLVWGFDLPTLIGFWVGFIYVCICYVYLGVTCERSVGYGVKKAKRLMLGCYLTRYAGLFALCAFAMLTKHINVVGVLLPQFYPRIILTLMQFFNRKDNV